MAVKLSVPGSAKLPEEKDVSPNTFPGNHKAQSGALAKTWDGCEATDGWLVLLATQPALYRCMVGTGLLAKRELVEA